MNHLMINCFVQICFILLFRYGEWEVPTMDKAYQMVLRNYSSSIFWVRLHVHEKWDGKHYNPAFPKKLGSSQAASDSPLTSVGQLSED